MPVEPEATPKPRTRRKAAADGVASLGALASGPDETDHLARAVERLQDSVDVLADDVKAISIVVTDRKPGAGDSEVLKSHQQLVEKVDLLIEVFRLYLHLTTEADRSTKQRVRTIRRVLDRYMARHDKTEAKRQPMTWTNIGLLALGSILAIIGVVSVIGWVFE